MNGIVSRAALGLLVLLIAALTPACAVFNPENRRVLNWLDGQVQPESTTARIALAPVGVPVGSAALVLDMAVVHPVSVIPDAADDVYELYWKPRDMDWFRKALIFPLITVATPPTFLGDWLGRALFDIN